jgi:hypothetical protein
MTSKKDRSGIGLENAIVLSATEENLASDLVATKAVFLYAEKIQLASARLYHTLLAMRQIPDAQIFADLEDLADAVGLLDPAGPQASEEPGVTITEGLPPDEQEISAVRELANGFRKKAFEVAPYPQVVKTQLEIMRGELDVLDSIPVLDQATLDRLDGITRVTLQSIEPDAPGPLAGYEDRTSARRAWLANEFLGHMPGFPDASWDALLSMREQLAESRGGLLIAMNKLTEDLDEKVTPGEVADRAASRWKRIVEGELEQINDELEAIRRGRLSDYWGRGAPSALVGIAVAVTGGVVNHLDLSVAAGLSSSVAVLSQVLVQQRSAEILGRRRLKTRPFWFLHQTSNLWRPPRWNL